MEQGFGIMANYKADDHKWEAISTSSCWYLCVHCGASGYSKEGDTAGQLKLSPLAIPFAVSKANGRILGRNNGVVKCAEQHKINATHEWEEVEAFNKWGWPGDRCYRCRLCGYLSINSFAIRTCQEIIMERALG
jgi:hypothetical protein